MGVVDENTAKELRKIIAAKDAEIERLRGVVHKVSETRDTLHAERDSLKRQLAEARKEIAKKDDAFTRTANNLTNQLAEARREIERLRGQLEKTESNARMERRQQDRLLAHQESQLAEARRAYDELIFAVASRFPDETRHETALRYIREAENRCSGPHQAQEDGA